jgi:hypothetical protein
MAAHEPRDALAADGMALGAQLGVDARCSVSFPVLRMDPPDVDQQLAVGDFARALYEGHHRVRQPGPRETIATPARSRSRPSATAIYPAPSSRRQTTTRTEFFSIKALVSPT